MDRQPHILPADRYLASLLGISDEEYAWYKQEVYKRAAEGPQPAVVAGAETLAIISLVLTVLSVGVTIAASFFKPQPNDGTPAQIKARNRGGRSNTENERFVPRYGFDSSQDVAPLGSVVPIVYALQENGFGGVRVNTPLLWSQIYSLGGSQLLRAIFMISEGPIGNVDTKNFAAGGNVLSSYDFGSATAVGSRMTVYGRYSAAHGLTSRINSSHYVFGRSPSTDKGNANSSDIYQINGTTDFCSAVRPNNQTTFGVYALCGNNLAFRTNPTIKPYVQAQLIPEGNDGDAIVKCTYDDVAWVQRRKTQTIYSSRAGITQSGLGSIGGTTIYQLFQSSDKDTAFSKDLQTITDVSKWDDSFVREVRETAGSSFNKSLGADVDSKGRWLFEFDNTNEETLLNRLGITITNVSITDGGKRGRLRAQITFNTGTIGGEKLWDSEDFESETLDRLEALKITKFRIKFQNIVDPSVEDDDISVAYTLRVRVKHSRKQKFKYIDGSPIYGGPMGSLSGYTNGQLEVANIGYTPTFKIRSDEALVSANGAYGELADNYTVVGNGILRCTVELKFPIKNIYSETCEDVAASIAGRQRTWDDSLIVGELYKIGSALAVCTSRDEVAFVSNADVSSGDGQNVNVYFTTVRVGAADVYAESNLKLDAKTWLETSSHLYNVGTTGGHILRCAIASISTSRPCRAVEIGIRSRLGIRVRGICNFKESLGFDECNNRACLNYKGDRVDQGGTLKFDIHQSNTVSAPVERYSFNFIYYREAGSGAAFTKLPGAYGFRGATQQNQYNAIRLDFGSTKQWEIQIEPCSSWEVRLNSVGTLYVLDSSLSTVVTAGIASFRGTTVSATADTFAITVGRRKSSKGGLGIRQTDSSYSNGDRSYIDTWGKLAEAFVFDEVTSSAESGPEHEVVFLNEICSNTDTPYYDNLAILGVNIMSSVEWQQFGQFSCYVTQGKICKLLNAGGTGPTHLFPEILYDLLTNETYGRGDLITDSMIDLDSFKAAATWCSTNQYYFDGVVADRINLRQWAADTAAAHLLIFGESDGRFFLRPAIGTPTIKGLFTAGNIAEGSFQLQYFDPEERDPVQISVRYREERPSSSLTNPGTFPTVREVLVRELDSTPSTAITESLDLSDYCTNRQHAIDAAKYFINMRRLPTHTIRFTTTHEGVLAEMGPGDHIRVAMDITEYNEFNNGAVTAAGALVSTTALSDGAYSVIAWNGESTTAPYSTTLTVSGGGTVATPTGIVFTVTSSSSQVRTYQIERVTPNDDGTFTLEAVHMPDGGMNLNGNWSILG